jgi:t-SNARE complex subunit (syntaxin)
MHQTCDRSQIRITEEENAFIHKAELTGRGDRTVQSAPSCPILKDHLLYIIIIIIIIIIIVEKAAISLEM